MLPCFMCFVHWPRPNLCLSHCSPSKFAPEQLTISNRWRHRDTKQYATFRESSRERFTLRRRNVAETARNLGLGGGLHLRPTRYCPEERIVRVGRTHLHQRSRYQRGAFLRPRATLW